MRRAGYPYVGSALALTYDDGPDGRLTGPLLDLLAEAGVSATFFPIAARAAAWPDLVARMSAGRAGVEFARAG